ncbi:hypothetical protein [Piscirickettsia litoralis]|uniref:Uncharacterized protein n=1 Tax=Piscirickettsia litoralis TaxID=1891921 RepID=A0ABX3A346_9GAMM|nr:hypothetical protein [Piscirickettsia litoralis]ODN42930.1 hypothetical protein BGC07_08335 [Piscirickettsia litoralis]
MLEVLKWVVIIQGCEQDQVIHFESNNNAEDVRRVALRVARLRGINLKEVKHEIMTETEYQKNRDH